MKLTHKFLVFFVLAVGISSCFDPPAFPTTPEIEFESISYGQSAVNSDSIVLRFNFKDGDGNIGINKIITSTGEEISNFNDPFHDSNFYLSDGGTSLKEIGIETFYTDTFQNGVAEFVPLRIFSTRNQSGKLVTRKNQAGSTQLPAFLLSDLNCRNYIDYKKQRHFIFEGNWNIIDDSYFLASDTIRDAFGNRFIEVKDTLYFQVNPNHYTIEVDFLIKGGTVSNPTFTEYDWRKEFCGQTFDGRFSQLSDTNTPLEGTLTYTMRSFGFRTALGSKKMKLAIKIKDRDFNVSNEIFTPEFTLDEIKSR